MDCSECLKPILRDLKNALKSEDVRSEVEKIIKKYSKRRRSAGKKTPKDFDFILNAGEAYYLDEERSNVIYKIFKVVVEKGYRGLSITRTKPESLEYHGVLENVKYYWLSSVKCDNCVPPGDLSKLISIIKEFLKGEGRGVVLIEGVDALIINNDFRKFIKFVQAAKDAVSEKKGVLLVSVNMKAFEYRERVMLQNELKEIKIRKK